MRRLEYTKAMEQRFENNPKMGAASDEFEVAAEAIVAEFGQKDVSAHKRRVRRNLGAWVGGSILGLTCVLGITYVGLRSQPNASAEGQLSATITASTHCYPIQPESSIKTIAIPKEALPLKPTNIEIADKIAQQVPGAYACDGNVSGVNRYQSFIALTELDQPSNSSSANLESLAEIFKQQTGPEAIFLVPTGIYPKVSS